MTATSVKQWSMERVWSTFLEQRLLKKSSELYAWVIAGTTSHCEVTSGPFFHKGLQSVVNPYGIAEAAVTRRLAAVEDSICNEKPGTISSRCSADVSFAVDFFSP